MRPQSTPGEAPPTAGSGGPSWGGGFVTGCLVSATFVAALCAGVLYTFRSFLSLGGDTHDNRGPLFQMGGVIAVLVAAHLGTVVATRRIHPGRTAVVVTQVPFIAAYATVPIWWKTGLWPPLYIAWGVATASAVIWLILWYARSPADPRRAVVFLAALAVLVAGNGAGVALVTWRTTNGFGLLGQRSPWTAMDTLTSASCLTGNSFHRNGSRVVQADCPRGPDADFYAGAYDEGAFDDTLCGDQPRAAFQKWWDWNRRYQISFTLYFGVTETVVDGRRVGPPYPPGDDTVPGDRASMTVRVELRSAIHPGDNDPWTIRINKAEETWTVRAESVAVGGWKICAIAVADPIEATFEPAR